MDNMSFKNKKLLSITLSTIGVVISAFIPFFGYACLIPSLVMTSKREDITLLHLFVFNIVALVSITIVLIVSFVQTIL